MRNQVLPQSVYVGCRGCSLFEGFTSSERNRELVSERVFVYNVDNSAASFLLKSFSLLGLEFDQSLFEAKAELLSPHILPLAVL